MSFPIGLQIIRFFFRQMNYRSMFGRNIISGFHHSFIKTTQILEIHKIRCFHKAKIMRSHTEHIIHQHPFLLSNSFPYIRRLTGLWFKIIPPCIVYITTVYPVGYSLLDASRTIVRHIKQMILIPYLGDVSINGRHSVHRIFK